MNEVVAMIGSRFGASKAKTKENLLLRNVLDQAVKSANNDMPLCLKQF
jgi:hypothetical protein